MIDIMLLVCNRIAFLKQSIKMFEDRLSIPFRLIFINNNSRDGTTEYINELKEKANYPVIHIFQKESKELPSCYAHNKAMKYVKSEFFITTQDDILIPDLEPCVLTQMIDLMKKYPECGALSLRNQQMRRKPLGDEEIMYNINSCPAMFRIQRKEDINNIGGFGQTNRWEDTVMMNRCRYMGKKAGIATNLRCNDIGLGKNRGYPDWHIKAMKSHRGFEWCNKDKHQYEPDAKSLDPKTFQPI